MTDRPRGADITMGQIADAMDSLGHIRKRLWWVYTSAYFMAILAVVLLGVTHAIIVGVLLILINLIRWGSQSKR